MIKTLPGNRSPRAGRRACIVGLCASITVPRYLHAQGEPRVIGFLHSGSAELFAPNAPAFRDGLADQGYVAGQNLLIEYRYAGGDYKILPALAADLIQHKTSVVAAFGLPAILALKAATALPIVFATGADPISSGLVASIRRPGGNLTGLSLLSPTMATKQLEVLHELMPKTGGVGVLVNPKNEIHESQLDHLRAGAGQLKFRLLVARASKLEEIEDAYTSLTRQGAGAIIVPGDAFFVSQQELFVALQNRYAMPTVLEDPKFATLGGLMSFSPNMSEAYREFGRNVGQVLNGANPAELPVAQPTKFAMVFNLHTAKAFGLAVPPSVLARADDVIE